MKSLWGSLCTRYRINLDLALALAPPAALRYELAHELCHLELQNHSPRCGPPRAPVDDLDG